MGGRGCMPPNFSWVVEGLLAACAYPRTEGHYSYMRHQGVSQLISLTERPAPTHKAGVGLEVIHIGMPDFTPPSISQVDEFISHVKKAQIDRKAVAVHCHMGRGRTGTMCACYLVHTRGLSPDDAIKTIRRMRPGSIETSDQEQLVHTYSDYLRDKGH